MSDTRRWKDKDPNGHIYYNRLLTSKAKKWTSSDFKISGQEVFNYHFEHAGTSRMTDWELTYLHSLIEEYKDLKEDDQYRKLEIWRALNWAPVFQQFAFVMPLSNKSISEQQKFAVNFSISKGTTKRNFKSFKGFWVEPFNETYYDADDRDIMSDYNVSPKTPDNRYPNHSIAKIKTVVPAFVLPRTMTPWGISIRVTKKDGSVVERGLTTPWDIGINGEIIKIKSLDEIIRAKLYGWRINGQEIPDQEIVHYIRRKYGFAHAVADSINTNSGLPYAYWYIIPFYDDERNKCLNLGQYIPYGPSATGKLKLVDKDISIQEQLKSLDDDLQTNAEDTGGVFLKDYYKNNYNTLMSITNNLIPRKISDNKIESNYLPTWNQIFYFSTIRAYWRASKILNETLRFTNHISDRIEKSRDILIVSGEVGTTPNSEDFDDAIGPSTGSPNRPILDREVKKSIFFVSGKEDGKSNYKTSHPDEDFRVSARIDVKKISDHLDYHERPWNKIFKYSKEGKNAYAKDRNVHKKNECFTTKQYMRNILIPNVAPYVSNMLYDETQNTYTRKALDNRSLLYKPMWSLQLNSSGLNLLEKKAVDVILGAPLETVKYSDFTKNMKSSKTIVFGSIITIVIISEIISFNTGHESKTHKFFHALASQLEIGLTSFKVGLGLSAGEIINPARDLLVYAAAVWLNSGAKNPFTGLKLIPKGVGVAISISITIGVFLYDRWVYSKDNLKKMDDMVKLFNDATNLGVLEGPYAQTSGAVRIKKGTDGSLPINLKTSPDGKTVTNEYQNVQSTQNIDKKESSEERRKRLNTEFLESGGKWETKFFKQLKEIECQTLLDIAKKTTQSDGRSNPVLNQAPNHIDVGAFRPKQSGKMNGINTKELKNLEVYFTFGLNDVNIIEPDWIIMNNFREVFRDDRGRLTAMFRYTRSDINSKSDLTGMIYGTVPPTEKYTLSPYGHRGAPAHEYDYKLPLTITDKEKVYLIRKKYGLDEVIPGGNCCSVFDYPVDKNIFPIKTDCQYLYDFTSPAFIKKLEDFCGKKDNKNTENSNKDKASAVDGFPATKHGTTEELRVQHEIKLADANAQINRRDLKRKGTDGSPRYEGTADSTRNLGQLPRFGIQAVIPGNTDTFSLPMTDSESQQDIAFEFIDTERSATADFIANLVINYVGFTLSKLTYQIKESEKSSTPLTPGKRTYEKIYYVGNRRIT